MVNGELWQAESESGALPSGAAVIVTRQDGFRLWVDGRELAAELRTPETSRDASRVAVLPPVRRWVTDLLRRLAQEASVVAEGRDLGSVVFPEADVKFYLEADLSVRAARRQAEEGPAAQTGGLEATRTANASRDHQDETRAAAPLAVPEGALRLDTSRLGSDEVVNRCLDRIREVLGPEH